MVRRAPGLLALAALLALFAGCGTEPASAPPTTAGDDPAAAPVDTAPTATQPTEPSWIWAGFEVMGYRTVTRQQILEPPPAELGTPFDPDMEALTRWCSQLQQRLDLAQTLCSPLRFADGKSYLVIDIVEHGDEARARFRDEPSGEVELATPEVRRLVEALGARQMALFQQGQAPGESADEGYLDYADEEMHGHVEALRRELAPHRLGLLEVIAQDGDFQKRAAAAQLLNWAGDVTDSIARVHGFLDDPQVLVRNNIARFMLHYVGQVEDPEVRRSVIRELAEQLGRPSHADRNKAVYGLLNIAQAVPGDRPAILAAAGEHLTELAERSLLINVRDPAAELLALLRGEESS